MRESKDIIHLVPHSHYDAAWAFNKDDSFYINIELIIRQAIELAKNTSFKFIIEQAFLLEHIKNSNYELFTKIKELIKKKKIEIAGGQYFLVDNMIPNGEVLVKEIIKGKKFIKENFDEDIVVSWGADEFGFNTQWPQILRESGYKYFAFRRGIHNSGRSEFIWRGLDGSTILSHWMPLGYRAGLDLTRLDESYNELKKHATSNQILMPSGSGSTPPQEETMKYVDDWNNSINNKSKIIISTPTEFFKALEKKNNNLSTIDGEMYSGKFSQVFPDCTSTRMWIKQGTKALENNLFTLERIIALANIMGIEHKEYDDILEKNWDRLLYVVEHDILPGTGIDEIYSEISEIFKNSETELKRSTTSLLKNLEDNIDNINNDDILIFNPLSWSVKNFVELDLEFNVREVYGIESLESNKKIYEIEISECDYYADKSIKKIKIGFIAEIPPFGYKLFKIIKGLKKENNIINTETKFENENNIINIDSTNAIVQILQKSNKNNKEIINKGNEICIEQEIGDLYYHKENIELIKSESGEGLRFGIFEKLYYQVIESKIKYHIKYKSKYYALRWPYRFAEKINPVLLRSNTIDIEKEIIIFKNLDRIDFRTKITNRHPNIRIRVKFETNIDNRTYWSGTQFGSINRTTDIKNTKVKGRWIEEPNGIFPSYEWIDYSTQKRDNNNFGVAILHKGTPSHEIKNRSIYLTLLRSVQTLSADGLMGPNIPTPDAVELKEYNYYYSLFTHIGNWKDGLVYQKGSEINLQLVAIQLKNQNHKIIMTVNNKNDTKTHHEKYYNIKLKNDSIDQISFFEIENKNIILSSISMSQNKKDIIIRMYETIGEKTNTKIKFLRKIKEVYLVDFLENIKEKISSFKENVLTLQINPYKIVTLKVKFE